MEVEDKKIQREIKLLIDEDGVGRVSIPGLMLKSLNWKKRWIVFTHGSN